MTRFTQLATASSRHGKALVRSLAAAAGGRGHSPREGRGRFRLGRRATFVEIIAGVAGIATVCILVGSAAVPTFPNNIAVFPDRDFVSIEGYEQYAGKTALVEVTRGGAVIGSAKALVATGGIAFEVNHPGGVCWGAGTTLQVTPDLRPGDIVSLKINTTGLVWDPVGDTTVGDAFVTQDATVSGNTVTVTGHIGDSVNPAFIEQRIVNPDLLATSIARRSISAIPGPLTPDPGGGYSSGLTVDAVTNTFTATYVFVDPAVAPIAASSFLGERAMSWQVQDNAGNRQGLTIAEFGEPGGPGMGGCPGGPSQIGSPAPGTAFVVRSADPAQPSTDQLKVDWVPVTAAPGADPVTGYSVEAIAGTANAAGERVQNGTRVGVTATQTTIRGLAPGEVYTVEVRSSSTAVDGSTKLSAAFPVQVPASGDITAPALTATPTPGTLVTAPAPTSTGVTLKATDPAAADPSASDPKAQIWYTKDGKEPFNLAGDPSPTATLYTGAIPVASLTTPTEIRAMAWDPSNNHSNQVIGFYVKAAADPVPPAPTALIATAGQASVTLQWTSTDTTVTGWGVQLYKRDASNTLVADGPLRETTAKPMTITGLTAGAHYAFTVKAKNTVGYGLESAMSTPDAIPTAITDQVTITLAKWKLKDFRVIGTGSLIGATVTIRIGTATACPLDGTLVGSPGLVVAAVLPATGGAFDFRFKDAAAGATQPAWICAFSSGGGISAPFKTTAG